MSHFKIHIGTANIDSFIEKDGERLTGVVGFSLEHSVESSVPVVKIAFLAGAIDVEIENGKIEGRNEECSVE